MVSPKTLNYAPAPPRWKRRGRTALLGAVVLLAVFATWHWSPGVYRQARLLYWQRQCLNFSQPADFVVYEEEQGAAATLLTKNGYSRYVINRAVQFNAPRTALTAASYAPACWGKLQNAQLALPQPPTAPVTAAPNWVLTSSAWQPGTGWGPMAAGRPAAVIFMHERTSPAGHRRLVVLTFTAETGSFQPGFIDGENVDTLALTPATWRTPVMQVPKLVGLDVMSGWPKHPPHVRIYAGQIDPADPARFAIRYQIWGQEDVLDGKLEDNDQVTLTARRVPQEPRE